MQKQFYQSSQVKLLLRDKKCEEKQMKGRWKHIATLLIFVSVMKESLAQAMKYVSTEIVLIPDNVNSSKGLLPVAKLRVKVNGNYNPLSLLQFHLKAAGGKGHTEGTNITVYYTGTVDSFSVAQPFKNLKSTKKEWIVAGEQELQAGTNYFWIAVDDKGEAQAKNYSSLRFVSCVTGCQEYTRQWVDEFEKNGPPDPANWHFEKGFVRNEEDQWYQPENAFCKSGRLILEARNDSFPNPMYEAGSRDWQKKRPFVRYTSGSIKTSGKQAWTYGRFELKARLDTNSGCWPAWWMVGTTGGNWPANGEIDMMEFYRGKILANYAVATPKPATPKWFSTATPIADFHKKDWTDSFHHWRMDWDSLGLAIYLDEILLNYQPQRNLYNRSGDNSYFPFRHSQFMLLGLAIGGQNGGSPAVTPFPRKFEIDYVRVLQKVKGHYSNQIVHRS